jgi:uncharacterized protein YecE (DUF72 family)
MRVLVGTSGYSYKEWKGTFYPKELAAAAMLRYYSEQLPTVEINNTFYRMPTEKLLADWAAQVAPGFSFALKAPRRITHQKQLAGAEDDVAHLLRIASVMQDKLGPMLFQLPPFFKKDVARLQQFLQRLPEGFHSAFEFRNATWFADDVYETLRARNAALVLADVDEAPEVAPVATASYGYLRLRRTRYDRPALERWAARVREQPWQHAHVFFKHEDAGTGPRLAAELRAILDSAAPAGGP